MTACCRSPYLNCYSHWCKKEEGGKTLSGLTALFVVEYEC